MSVKLLTEHHLRVLSIRGGRTDSSESTLVKMPNYGKYHAAPPLQNCSDGGRWSVIMAFPGHAHVLFLFMVFVFFLFVFGIN